jgi:3-oxoacyl-[acyl-carrier-protein] synthase II
MNRVLITGLGMTSPLGADKASSFAAALEARSAVRIAPADVADRLPQILVAAAAVEPDTLLEKKYATLDRATQFALVAADEALTSAKITHPPEDATRFGVFVGIGFGGAQTVNNLYTRFFEMVHAPDQAHKNPTVMHPLSVPRMMSNAAAAAVSMRYGFKGASNTYSVACASSAVAIGEALRAIRHGYLDAAVVIGTEAMLNAGSLMAWNALRVMAKPDATNPAHSCRPFAADRSGFVLGEGAAALVLESEARAMKRLAPVLAEIGGYGCSSDAEHLTTPTVHGQVTAMQQALDEAKLGPQDVQYLNAHGTATETGDVIETQSIRAVFGPYADQLAVSSTKAVHGHLIGAGGAMEFALSIMAMNSGSLPPTANLEKPDPRCDLDFIPQQARHGCDVKAVMSNSFAFGGSNASLLARRYAP